MRAVRERESASGPLKVFLKASAALDALVPLAAAPPARLRRSSAMYHTHLLRRFRKSSIKTEYRVFFGLLVQAGFRNPEYEKILKLAPHTVNAS